jgi:hypothetical protein
MDLGVGDFILNPRNIGAKVILDLGKIWSKKERGKECLKPPVKAALCFWWWSSKKDLKEGCFSCYLFYLTFF